MGEFLHTTFASVVRKTEKENDGCANGPKTTAVIVILNDSISQFKTTTSRYSHAHVISGLACERPWLSLQVTCSLHVWIPLFLILALLALRCSHVVCGPGLEINFAKM